MRGRGLSILAICGVLSLAGGWYFGTRTELAEQTTIPSGGLMFPDLTAKLASVTKVEIRHQDKMLVLEKRPDGQWGVASMHDFPVLAGKLRSLLTGLTELRLMEARTADPAEFHRLGVEDPTGKGVKSNLLTLLDKAGRPVASVIVGMHRVRNEGSGAEEVYVRRPDQNQSWLAHGDISVDVDPAQWLDRTIMNISHTRIASVDVNDHALVFGKTGGTFALQQPADHPKLQNYKVDDVDRALETLTLQTVKADTDMPAVQEAGHAVFTMTDGLAVTVRVFHVAETGKNVGTDIYARFSASGPEAVKAEAATLNARLAGWSFQIPTWKEQALVPTLDDLKAPEDKKAATPAPAETPAPPTATGGDPVAK